MLALWKQSLLHPVAMLRDLKEQPFSVYWHWFLLVGMGSIYFILFQSASVDDGMVFPAHWVLIASIIFAIPSLWFSTVIYGIIIHLFAKLLKGSGTFGNVQKALYISNAPNMIFLPIAIIWSFASSETFFTMVGGTAGIIGNIIGIFFAIWCFIVSIYTVAEAEHFSKLRAFVTMLVPYGIIFIIGGVSALIWL